MRCLQVLELSGIQQINVSFPFHNPLMTVWGRDRERERELRAASASVSNSDDLERGRAGLKQLITAKFPEDLIFSIMLPFI